MRDVRDLNPRVFYHTGLAVLLSTMLRQRPINEREAEGFEPPLNGLEPIVITRLHYTSVKKW